MSSLTLRQKLSLILCIAGGVILLFGALLLFAGKPASYFDFMDCTMTAQSSDIKSVVIEIGYGDVNITSGTGFKLNATGVGKDHFENKITNNVLYITYKTDAVDDAYLAFCDAATTFDIVLPNKLLEEVTYIHDRGSSSLKGITCNSFTCVEKCGDLQLNGVSVNHKADIKTGSGSCEFSSCTLHNPVVESSRGNLTMLKSRLTNMKYTASFGGKLKIAGCNLNESASLDLGFANADIMLSGNGDLYGFSFDKGRGDIKVNGEDYQNYDNTTAVNNIVVKNGFGDVIITFSSTNDE